MKTRGNSGKKRTGNTPLTNAFELPKYIRQRIKECGAMADKKTRDIIYLWIHVSEEGIAQPSHGQAPSKYPPSLEEWLNVIDEAAAAGVNWLMATLDTPADRFPDLFEICRWAQETYQMKVGLHIARIDISESEQAMILQLAPELTRLFVKQENRDAFMTLEKQGIKVRVADPQPYGEKPNCQGADRMVFVDPHGVLYTCGLVEGNREYRLGNIHERPFSSLLQDPDLPHEVDDRLHRVSQGCDGCPSLIANYLDEE